MGCTTSSDHLCVDGGWVELPSKHPASTKGDDESLIWAPEVPFNEAANWTKRCRNVHACFQLRMGLNCYRTGIRLNRSIDDDKRFYYYSFDKLFCSV